MVARTIAWLLAPAVEGANVPLNFKPVLAKARASSCGRVELGDEAPRERPLLLAPTSGSGRLAPERLAQRGLDRRAFGVLAFMNARDRLWHPRVEGIAHERPGRGPARAAASAAVTRYASSSAAASSSLPGIGCP